MKAMKKIKEMLRRIGTAGLAAIMLTAQMPVTAFAEEIAQPKAIGIQWDETTSFTYDGGPHVPSATATGTVNQDVIGLTITVTGDNASNGGAIAAGNYTATVTGITGEKAANYKLPDTGLTKNVVIVFICRSKESAPAG